MKRRILIRYGKTKIEFSRDLGNKGFINIENGLDLFLGIGIGIDVDDFSFGGDGT
jgi:hypothetical protein